ncbi:phage tail sheath C-terminal domain-containing protein [Ruegeria sp. HKCCD8929]|uniref:phage tail sheath family protein n=1 Tax=Ruegeria sp. HKCCD8929 TaxID=2683006 RepID=UPI0020C41409|nr:phage tail sheath C-terminal domain-containing protein [Ruegeria sp. HKCCD8929]
MAVSVSYPGVYIQEVPSGARAIAGVPTAIGAFVGYTARGPVDEARQIFSYADFERLFGGLHVDSDLSYAVQHFFLNGGGTCWIVRVAENAAAATVSMETTGGAVTLTADASSEGVWGNALLLAVDYDTADPVNSFNLTVDEIGERNGRLVSVRSETHRNLSMNDRAATYAVDAVNAASDLVELTDADLPGTLAGTSTSSVTLADGDVAALTEDTRRLNVSVDGGPSTEIRLFDGANDLATVDDLRQRIEDRVNAIDGVTGFTCTNNAGVLTGTSGDPGRRSSVVFRNAASQNAAAVLGLGVVNGGREIAGARETRPAASGTTGDRIPDFSAVAIALNDPVTVNLVALDAAGAVSGAVIDTLTHQLNPIPASMGEARAQVQAALAASPEAAFSGATVDIVDDTFVVRPGTSVPGLAFTFTGAGADALGLTGGAAAPDDTFFANIAAYQPGVGQSSAAQVAGLLGSDGIPPTTGTFYTGSRAAKTGMYALEDADLFNIFAIPGIPDVAVLAEAIVYCEERRAMIIVDIDPNVDTLDEARDWVNDGANSSLKSTNSAAYFPRIRLADPLQNGRLRSFPNSGLLAGLWARTDGARGVWKAPAGIDAGLNGVQALDYVLSDPENGVLNPLGLNCLRTFPVFGTVSWGARTLVGADARTSEWKYIPVRRTALFIEESLYRGTQFAVFEPNDEPLWAQIRLAVGSFMNNLFRQGAFQGAKPSDAYFVRCDSTTTTQADIDLGIVNIHVGFAPLKPAEFVVISIQQIAGQSPA